MVRKTLFNTTAIEVLQIPLREIGLNSEYGKDNWGFIAKGQSEGVSGWKIIKRTNQG